MRMRKLDAKKLLGPAGRTTVTRTGRLKQNQKKQLVNRWIDKDERMERCRTRLLILGVQMGGAMKQKALRRLRPKIRHSFVRWIVHPENKCEHYLRPFDATSRKLLLEMRRLQTQTPTLVSLDHLLYGVVLICRGVLVDNAPVSQFLARLRELTGVFSLKDFTNAALESLQSRPDRPTAYFPFGRGKTRAEYVALGQAAIHRMCRMIGNTPPLQYTPNEVQQLLGLNSKERGADAQFSAMQVAMDLQFSPSERQLLKFWGHRRSFYMAGPGVYKEMRDKRLVVEACASHMCTGNSQMRALLGEDFLHLNGMDSFFFAEHAFCADRKYENQTHLLVEPANMSTGTISERYADASKESEYEAVLAIIQTALSRVRQARGYGLRQALPALPYSLTR